MTTIPGPPGDPIDHGPLLTRGEAAQFLNVSESTVYRLIRGGELPAYIVIHSIRISQVALEIYLRQLPPLPED
jgi:excisionase family DNA binding protein